MLQCFKLGWQPQCDRIMTSGRPFVSGSMGWALGGEGCISRQLPRRIFGIWVVSFWDLFGFEEWVLRVWWLREPGLGVRDSGAWGFWVKGV